MDPNLVDQLSNLSFVVDDVVLSDDANAVILSLIEEFNRIASSELKHNIELSQYYGHANPLTSKNGSIICDNCEIVLKYVDTTVCITNGKIIKHVSEENGRYYHRNESGEKTEINCQISRGLIRLYLKQKIGYTYKYARIRVVSVKNTDTLEPYTDKIYQNNDEIRKLEEATNIAIAKGQSKAFDINAKNGDLQTNTPSEVVCATKTINDIITDAKNASANAQLSKINTDRFFSQVPPQSAVNAAQCVSNNIMNTKTADSGRLTTVMVPGNEPIPLQSNNNLENVVAVINPNGLSIHNFPKNINTFNSKIINGRSSLVVDANLAVVPAKNIVTDPNIDVVPANAMTSITNKLSQMATDIQNKAGDLWQNLTGKTQQTIGNASDQSQQIVSNLSDKISSKAQELWQNIKNTNVKSKADDFLSTAQNKLDDLKKSATDFVTKQPKSQTNAVVVPVSKFMSVLVPSTRVSPDLVPIPKNNTLNLLRDQNTQAMLLRRYENKLGKHQLNNNISIQKSNTASQIVINGNASVKKAEEEITTTSADTTSNRTIARNTRNIHNTRQPKSSVFVASPNTQQRYKDLAANLALSDLSDSQLTIRPRAN